MQALQENRRLVLIGFIALLLLCLVGVLIFNVFFRGGGGNDVADSAPPAINTPTEAAPTTEPTDEMTESMAEDDAEAEGGEGEEVVNAATATAQSEAAQQTADGEAEATTEPTDEPTTEPTTEPEPAPAPTSTLAPGSGSNGSDMTVQTVTITRVVGLTQTGEVLENGDFEDGFGEDGVGSGWGNFRTGDAVVNFVAETAEVFVQAGDHAQRISIDKGYQPNQYGGIFQTVEVVPGQMYTLTLYGQIRSGFGSVQSSNYGYRLQYAIDQSGGQSWQTVTDWVEMPWPEQSFDVSNPSFSSFSAQFVPENEQATLFVRAWNKWPDQSLGEYTLDNLSMVGPVPGNIEVETVVMAAASPVPGSESSGEAQVSAPGDSADGVVDRPLPVTGNGDSLVLVHDGRFWGAVLVLALLVVGALYRARWRW